MFERIKKDIISSMKEQNKFKLSVLRMLKSSIEAETINKKHMLNDDEILTVIKKQVKVRNASLEEYKKYSRLDLIKSLEQEIEILKSYLPEELSIEEVNKIINDKFAELNPTSIKDMGNLIKEVSVVVGTRADMSMVSKIIKDKLNSM